MDDFFAMTNKRGKYPCYGCYNFIEYYFEKVKGNKGKANRYRQVKFRFQNKFEQYKYGFILLYAMSDYDLNNLKEYGAPVDTFKMCPVGGYCNPVLSQIFRQREEARKDMKECDQWLTDIGFYDEYDESHWKYAIEVKNTKRYQEPKCLNDFRKANGKKLKKCSSEYVYCTEGDEYERD